MTLSELRAKVAGLPDGVSFTRDAVLQLLGEADGVSSGQAEDYRLTAEEAAVMLNVSVDWLYRRTKELPFARKLSRKVVRYSEAGIKRYLTQRDSA